MRGNISLNNSRKRPPRGPRSTVGYRHSPSLEAQLLTEEKHVLRDLSSLLINRVHKFFIENVGQSLFGCLTRSTVLQSTIGNQGFHVEVVADSVPEKARHVSQTRGRPHVEATLETTVGVLVLREKPASYLVGMRCRTLMHRTKALGRIRFCTLTALMRLDTRSGAFSMPATRQ